MIRDHVAKKASTPVRPNRRMVLHWWRKLNIECFHGILLPPTIRVLDCKWQGDVCGLCWPGNDDRVTIDINPVYNKTRGEMLSTLAHEMIHQWQHQHGESLKHGRTFKAWVDLIAEQTGLTP